MNPKVAADPLAVEEIVNALTGPLDQRTGKESSLAEVLSRVARDLDRRAAVECANVLADCVLAERPRTGELEALVILGLAHPRLFQKYGLSLANEGRRLSLLLENDGRWKRAKELLELLAQLHPEDREIQQDLASLMRRTGGVDQFIERCIQRAEEEARAGRYMEAVSSLQEVLLHDQSRRDVARMIRDLRYEEMAKRLRRRSRTRLALFFCFLAVACTALVLRELGIQKRYAELPEAAYEDEVALRTRLAAIQSLVEQHRFWLGYFVAVDEQSLIQRQIDSLEGRESARQREEIRELEQRQAMAESERAKGLAAIEQGDMRDALSHLRTALELCTEDWEHKERVSADVAAIESWMEGQEE